MLEALIYDDGSRQGELSTRVCVTFTAVSLFFVILRIYTRAFVVHRLGLEDWTVLSAWICALVYSIFSVLQVRYGNGHHVQSIKPAYIVLILRSLWISFIFYQIGLCLVKFSILWQYHRIFPSRGIRLAIFVMVGVTVAYFFWSVFDNIFACTPVTFFWDKSHPGGHCLPQSFVWFSNASINIVTDLIIFVMPLPLLGTLQLPRRQKWALICVFALGGLVCVVSVLRLAELYKLTRSTDPNYDSVTVDYWTATEINVAIICACLPCLKALAAHYLPALVGLTARGDISYRSATGTARASRITSKALPAWDGPEASKGPGPMIEVVTTIKQVQSGGEEV